MMNADQITTALRRANKRQAHALAQLAKAESESARKRHARRAMNATRGLRDIERTFQAMGAEYS